MAFTIQDVFDDLRDLNVNFSDPRAPERVLLTEANAVQVELFNLIVDSEETLLGDEHIEPLPLPVFSQGFQIPEHHAIHSVLVTDGAAEPLIQPVTIVPYHHRFARNRDYMACWTYGGSIFLAGTARQWVAWDDVVVAYTPAPVPFDLVTPFNQQVPTLTDDARPVMVYRLAAYMAERLGLDPAGWAGRAAVAQTAFESALLKRNATAQTFMIQDAFPI